MPSNDRAQAWAIVIIAFDVSWPRTQAATRQGRAKVQDSICSRATRLRFDIGEESISGGPVSGMIVHSPGRDDLAGQGWQRASR